MTLCYVFKSVQSSQLLARLLPLVTICVLLQSVAVAQQSNASVNGSVRDPNGAAVPDAQLILRNTQTNVERRAVSNGSGEYLFVQIQPGEYTIETSKAGFRSSKIEPFTLGVNQASTIDIALAVGDLQQTVTVEAVGEAIQSASAGLGGTVSEKQVANLPLNGRNFTQLITLSPGVSPISVGQNGGGGEAAVPQNSSFVMGAINGQTNRSTFYLTDGVVNANVFFGTYGVAPILDSLQEFKVNSHADDAQFGGSLGGTINVVTKSGTNDLHGSLWEFVRNDAFDARNTFLPRVTPFKQNQYGFTVGGPVILPKLYNGRNRTFFYGGMEWYKYRQSTQSFLTVPTAVQLAGNLSDITTPLYNPFSTRLNAAGQIIRDPFPNNQIPANLINPGTVAYANSVLPAPQNVGVAGKNAIDTTPIVQNMRSYTARLDQNFGERDFFWFRFSRVDQDTTQSGGLPNIRQFITRPGYNYGASYIHTFSPTFTMQLQFGRLLTGQNLHISLVNVDKTHVISQLGLSSGFTTFADGSTLLPGLNVSGYFGAGEYVSLEPSLGDIYQYKANLSKAVGNHTISFGGEFDTTNYDSFYEQPNLTFIGTQTSNPQNSAQVGSPLASFLLGVPDSATRRNVHETFRPGGVMGAYVQDSWKATPKLTVNIGLRYDITFINPYGKESTMGQPGGIETGDLDLTRGIYLLQKVPPSCADRGHAPCLPNGIPAGVQVTPDGKILQNTYTNFGPRLGLAYRLDAKTVLRSGFGIFYDNFAGTAQRAQSIGGNWPDVGLIFLNGLNRPTTTQLLPNTLLPDVFAGSPLPTADPFQRVQRYFDPHLKNPYSMQWNFGLQRELGGSTVIDVNYVGSGSRRLSVADYYNVALTPGPGPIAPRRLFPNITPTYFETSSGNSSYNALQAQLGRRFQHGLQFQFSYTWSKSIDVGCSGFFGVEGCSIQDPYHTNLDRSVSGFDLTHIFSGSILYALPIGKGKLLSTGNRLADYILGNWQLNTLAIARSGTPYNITYSADTGNTGNVLGVRPSLVGDPTLSNPTPQRWFNTQAFAAPAQYTFGNLGRNAFRTQPFWNIDFSIFRQFPFGESRSVEFRAEAFNAVNTVIYGTPGTTFGVPTFGTVSTTANNARQLQFGLRVVF